MTTRWTQSLLDETPSLWRAKKYRSALRTLLVIFNAGRSVWEQGESRGEVGVAAGGQVACGEWDLQVGWYADAVDDLPRCALLVQGRDTQQAVVVQDVAG